MPSCNNKRTAEEGKNPSPEDQKGRIQTREDLLLQAHASSPTGAEIPDLLSRVWQKACTPGKCQGDLGVGTAEHKTAYAKQLNVGKWPLKKQGKKYRKMPLSWPLGARTVKWISALYIPSHL